MVRSLDGGARLSRLAAVAASSVMLWSMVGRLPVPAAAAEAAGLVTFSAPAACAMSWTKTFADGPPVRVRRVAYSLGGGRTKTAVHAFAASGPSITWTASIAPGAYRFDVYMWAAEQGRDDRGVCSGSGLVVVLPGDQTRATVEMVHPDYALDDMFWPATIYGRAPADVRLALFVMDGSPACGSPFVGAAPPGDTPERDSVGYWAELFQPFKRERPLLTLRVEQGSEVRFIRLATGFPRASMGETVSLRYDVTPERLRAAFARTPGTLLCL